jgi:hypothetical protein
LGGKGAGQGGALGETKKNEVYPPRTRGVENNGQGLLLLTFLGRGHDLSRVLPAFLVGLDFAVSLPQPGGDSEFVRRLLAVDSRLQRLSKLVLVRRGHFSGLQSALAWLGG